MAKWKKHLRTVHVGIDVSKDDLHVAWQGLDGSMDEFTVKNDRNGHAELLARVTAGRIQEARIVLEATGPYGTALVAFLNQQSTRAKVMVVQPRVARQFALASMRRAKTDTVDARVLCEFAYRMKFVPTVVPPKHVVALRGLARHMSELIDRRAAIKNQRHAAAAAGDAPSSLLTAMDREEKMLGDIIEELEAEIIAGLQGMPDAKRMYDRMVKIPGIKQRAAARLLPELLALPRHLTPKEAVAYAGLDPRPNQSGTSKNGKSWRISKQGNARIRRSLYLAALCAVRWFQPMKNLYVRLREQRGKLKKVAIVAAMRKLLTALWAMLARDEDFSEENFSRAVAVAA